MGIGGSIKRVNHMSMQRIKKESYGGAKHKEIIDKLDEIIDLLNKAP